MRRTPLTDAKPSEASTGDAVIERRIVRYLGGDRSQLLGSRKGKASGRDVAIEREAHGCEVGITHVWDRDAVQDGGYRYVADEVGLPLPRLFRPRHPERPRLRG